MNRQKMFAALFGLILALPFLANAQGLGSISGTVSDPSGAIVVSAQVRVADAADRVSRPTTTDSAGYYVVSSLRPADYTVTVTSSGFRTFTENKVTLQADQVLTLNPKLVIGSTNEVVEVQANALQVDT